MSAYLPARRPLSVTLIIGGVILFGVWNSGKALVLAQNSALLLTWGVRPNPRFQLIMALLWAVFFFIIAWFLRKKRPFTRYAVPILFLVYSVYTLGIRLLFSQMPLNSGEWLLSGIFFLGIISLTTFNLQRGSIRQYLNGEE